MKKSEKNSQALTPSLSTEARRDLKGIQNYISDEQESPQKRDYIAILFPVDKKDN